MLPQSRLYDKIELSAHLEFAIFLFTTVVGIPALVRRLAPRASPRWVWIARFLFPGTFLYDSSLSIGADHVGAMYGPAIFIATRRAIRDLDPRWCAVLGAVLSGAALTKESVALMLIPFSVIAVAVAAALRALGRKATSEPRFRWATGPAAAAVACVAFTAPLWLKNLVWHGNPVYPVGWDHFSGRPWTVDAEYLYRYGFAEYQFSRPAGGLAGLREIAKVLVNFSFVPNDYLQFHGKVPVFGSLFTLSLLCLPFLRKTKWIWFVVGWVHVGIASWYYVHHQDRYLQALVPLMAGVVAATAILIWRTTRLAGRALLLSLAGFQIVWGGDVYFIQTHAMVTSPLKRVIDLLESGYRKKYDERFEFGGDMAKIRQLLPRGSRLLLHENHEHLGVGNASITDWATYQFGIDYGVLTGPKAVYATLRDMGATHLAWITNKSRGWDSLAGDLIFFDFAINHTESLGNGGSYLVSQMPGSEPAEADYGDALVLSCKTPASGLYRLTDLRAPSFGPRRGQYPEPLTRLSDQASANELAGRAQFLVIEPQCHTGFSASALGFVLAAKRETPKSTANPASELWLKPRPR